MRNRPAVAELFARGTVMKKNLAGNFVSVANVNVILLTAGNTIHKSNSSLSKEQRMECHLVRNLQKFP